MSSIGTPTLTRHVLKGSDEKVFNPSTGFLLLFTKEGSGTCRLNQRVLPLRSGTAFCLSCTDFFEKQSSSTDAVILALSFSDDMFSSRLLEALNLRDFPLAVELKESPDTILTLFEMLEDEISFPRKGSDIFVRNLIKELMVCITREGSDGKTSEAYDIKTNLALLYIYSGFKESLSLESVAAHVHYSASYFYHSFQRNTGFTFQKYLHNLRLGYALNLLTYTSLSVTDICFECGFNSVQYFSTSFRKKFGKSPARFKSNINF